MADSDQKRTASNTELPNARGRADRILEFSRAIALSLAAVLVAWCGYQASRWGGLMSTNFSQAGAMRVESTRTSTAAGQIFLLDLSNFDGWLEATASGNNELADFYESRFRPEMRTAFEAWRAMRPDLNEDIPRSPFGTDAYNLSLNQQADELEQQAADIFAEGLRANQINDNYVLNTVILAAALAIAGIADRFHNFYARVLVTIVSNIMLVVGIVNAITYPVL